jgi:hypothetical protein
MTLVVMLALVPLVKAKVALVVKALGQAALVVKMLDLAALVVRALVQVAPLALAPVLVALVKAQDQVRREALLGEALLVVQDAGSLLTA